MHSNPGIHPQQISNHIATLEPSQNTLATALQPLALDHNTLATT